MLFSHPKQLSPLHQQETHSELISAALSELWSCIHCLILPLNHAWSNHNLLFFFLHTTWFNIDNNQGWLFNVVQWENRLTRRSVLTRHSPSTLGDDRCSTVPPLSLLKMWNLFKPPKDKCRCEWVTWQSCCLGAKCLQVPPVYKNPFGCEVAFNQRRISHACSLTHVGTYWSRARTHPHVQTCRGSTSPTCLCL